MCKATVNTALLDRCSNINDKPDVTALMGVDHSVDRGTCPPTFEVGGRGVFCPLYFWGDLLNDDCFSTAIKQ